MKDSIFAAAAAIILCITLSLSFASPPASAHKIARASVDSPSEAASENVMDYPEETQQSMQEVPVMVPQHASFDNRFRLPVLREGNIVSMTLHDYVLGAVLGEMPTSFHPQALRAQAVACRTYALRRYASRKHDPAAVCTDAGCCMNWVDPEVYEQQNGTDAFMQAEDAVSDTDGIAIYYQDSLIDATFFSSSGGRTESAADVWGSDVPYLQAVESPDEQSTHETDTVEIPAERFAAVLREANEMADFSEASRPWIGAVVYTAGGGVSNIELGGCIYTGVQLRRLFGLRSTRFRVELDGDTVVFTTHGFGHRVGMSQYGANAMAQNGSDYNAILAWYYTGVEVKKVPDS